MKNFVKKDRVRPGFVPPRVTAYMTPAEQLITFRADTPVREAVQTLLANRITGAPLLDERGAVVGLIDDKGCLQMLGDIARCGRKAERVTVASYATDDMKTILASADVLKAAGIFLTTEYSRLLVVDRHGTWVGQVSRRDILRSIRDYHHQARLANPLRRQLSATALRV